MEDQGQKNVTSYFMTIPIEIRCKIAGYLDEFKDLNNLCIYHPHLFEHVRQELETLSTRKMVGIVSKLPGVDVKTMRLVSKTWNKAVVESMDPSRVDLSIARGKNDRKYLITTIKLPLSTLDYRTIMDKGQKFRLVGRGLQLKLRRSSDNPLDILGVAEVEDGPNARAAIANLYVVNAATAMTELLGSVRHLEIFTEDTIANYEARMDDYESNWNGGVFAVVGPILQRINQGVRIRMGCISLAKVLRWLPSRTRIEELVVLEDDATGTYWEDWLDLLEACRLELKLLHGAYVYSRNLFPRLEELDLSFRGLLGQRCDCYIHQTAPNLKVLKVVCGRDEWVFLAELTHRLKFLHFIAIEMSVSFGTPVPAVIRHPSRPLTCAKFASRRLNQVFLNNLDCESDWEWKALPYLFESSTKVVRLEAPVCSEESEEDNEYVEFEIQKLTEDMESLKSPILPHQNEMIMETTVYKLMMLAEGRDSQITDDLLYDLLAMAKFVNGPVMVSKELWSYLGGPDRVSYKLFSEIAKTTMYVQSNPLPVPESMEKLYERFGPGFYRGIDYSLRMRSDEDWKKLMDSVCAAEPVSEEFSVKKWAKFLKDPHGIPTDEKIEFYINVVPRIRDQTVFGTAGENAKIELDWCTRATMIVLYHSIEKWNRDGVLECIRLLQRNKILKQLDDWYERRLYNDFFKTCALQGFEYFCTTRCHFKHFMSSFSHI